MALTETINEQLKTPHLTLNQKIKAAQKVIIEAYEKTNGKLFLSFSGGKDSRVMMDIALKIYPNLPVVFSNTTNEKKEVLDYVKKFPNIVTVTPKMPFKKVLEKYGFPLISKEVSQKINNLKHTNGKTTFNTRLNGDTKGNGQLPTKWRYLAEDTIKFDVTHLCCKVLKKDPLDKWGKERGLKPLIALMADESRLRQQLALYGDDKNGKVYPFLRTGWEEKDIWEYATTYNIRFAECYYDRIINGKFIKKQDRTGCEYCGFGITMEKEDKFENIKYLTPKRYESIMNTKNNGITFKEAIQMVKSPQKPYLDLYGVKILKSNKSDKKSSNGIVYDFYNLKNTIIQKNCPCCQSKNITKNQTYLMNFFDSPHPKTGNTRNIWSENIEYKCEDCEKLFFNDMFMFDMELRVTHRLKEYVKENLNIKSSTQLMLETNLSFGRLYTIAKQLIA